MSVCVVCGWTCPSGRGECEAGSSLCGGDCQRLVGPKVNSAAGQPSLPGVSSSAKGPGVNTFVFSGPAGSVAAVQLGSCSMGAARNNAPTNKHG